MNKMKMVAVLFLALAAQGGFADQPQAAGVAVAGVSTAGVGVAGTGVAGVGVNPGQMMRYEGNIYSAPAAYANLNGRYSVTSDRIQKGQFGGGTINFVSLAGSRETYSMNCTRAYDQAGTKTCTESSNNRLLYVTTANPDNGVVKVSVLDTRTNRTYTLGYIRQMP